MGVFLDSSVPIKAERLGLTETEMLRLIQSSVLDQPLATSAIVLTELLHGVYRAKTAEASNRRQAFFADFIRDVPSYPYNSEIAALAGRIGGQQAALGLPIPFVDLIIGATALHLNFSIITTNFRHFRLIPNLHVIPF